MTPVEQVSPDQVVQLNGSTLLAITGLLGTLSGVIGVLYKSERSRTEQQLKDLRERTEQQIEDIRNERDFYREALWKEMQRSDRSLNAAEEATKIAGRAVRAVR